MKVATARQMAELDRVTIEQYGIPSIVLMENAGRSCTERILRILEEKVGAPEEASVAVVCGRGNNGGDGFVAARLLAGRGYEVEVLALATSYDPSTPTGRNWARVREDLPFAGRLKKRPMALLVDAIFGTGLSRPVEGRERGLIREMNSLDRRWFPVVAVDIPSGLDANTGKPLGVAVEASATVTMGLPKAGFKAPGASKYLGEVIVAEIGFPPGLLKGS